MPSPRWTDCTHHPAFVFCLWEYLLYSLTFSVWDAICSLLPAVSITSFCSSSFNYLGVSCIRSWYWFIQIFFEVSCPYPSCVFISVPGQLSYTYGQKFPLYVLGKNQTGYGVLWFCQWHLTVSSHLFQNLLFVFKWPCNCFGMNIKCVKQWSIHDMSCCIYTFYALGSSSAFGLQRFFFSCYLV